MKNFLFARSAGSVEPRPSFFWSARDWLLGLILTLAVMIVYQPAWYAGFIWDDDNHLTANPCIVGPLGFWDIWTSQQADISPLTRSTFWLEHALWGLPPLPYHLVNVFLHAVCAVLLWRVLRRLSVPGAWLGAALWALHPVMVESVAWITEMKNTESGVFFLLSVFFFIGFVKDSDDSASAGASRYRDYALALLFGAMAMAAKSSTVILPLCLGLCAWWLGGRRWLRNALMAMPLLLLSLAAAAVSLWASKLQLLSGNDAQLHPEWIRGWPERLAGAGDAFWFFLGKLLWPHPLMTVYPRWQIDATQWFAWLPLAGMAVVLGLLWFWRRSWSRPYFFAMAWFVIALLPVLGLVDHFILRYSLVFDHFQYLAGMAPLALVGAGMARLMNLAKQFTILRSPVLHVAACTGILLALSILSWQRAGVFQSDETLWTDTLAKNPSSWNAHDELGNILILQGKPDQATDHFRKALKLNFNDPVAHNGLGAAFIKKKQFDRAIAEFEEALSLDPDYKAARSNLATADAMAGFE